MLEQNYPNPFNPTTTIRYMLDSKRFLILSIYDALGNEIIKLVNGEELPGIHKIKIEMKDISSGIYFYRLQAGNNVETKKMIFIK